MKKILYTLFIASLFAASCTEEILVTRDHDIDAEVMAPVTKMEMSVLYCNINDAEYTLDLLSVGEYLTAKGADVVTLVSPANVNGTKFSTWLTEYAAENGKQALSVENVDGRLCMGALLPADMAVEQYAVEQGLTFSNAVLHFKANDIHFVVTDLLEARNAIPEDWQDQYTAMGKTQTPIVYNPDNLALRKTEVEQLIARTMEYVNAKGVRPFAKDKNWLWSIDMNTPSNIDMKFGKQFARMECYDYDDMTVDYFTYESRYITAPSEYLAANDPFFALNDVMVKNGSLVDCIAVHYSVYAPSSVSNDVVTARNNFLYSSDGCWNMFESLTLDTTAVDELGTTHYPIMVTLKSEE